MKKIFVFAALLVITSTIVFAQAMPGASDSPQSLATQGRYRSAADNFIRPDAFAGVTFDKFYATTSFAATNRAQLGYATKIGSVYLAAAYGGSFWANYTPLNYQEQKGVWASDPDKKVPVYTFDATDPFANRGDPENRIGILIGLANMGFRFTFSSVGHEWIHFTDNLAAGDGSGGSVSLKSYDAERGAIIPQIAWAMTKGLTENGIQPYVVIDFGFTRNYIKGEVEGLNGVYIANSENHFDPQLTLGLGGYTFYKNNSNFRLSADLEYVLGLRIYDNEYGYQDGADLKVKTIKGLNGRGANLTENTYHSHLITTALAGQWSGGPLALRFRLNLPVTLIGDEYTPKTIKSDGELEGDVTTKNFTIGFTPNLRLGAQWKIVPKFALNAGGRINLYAGYQRTSETEEYKTVTERINAVTTNQLTAGFTFAPTDNLSFEVSSGIDSSNNGIKVFDPNGLLGFTNFLVGVKF